MTENCKVRRAILSEPNKFAIYFTQNMIKAFKFRAQAIFSLLEKTHAPGLQNLSLRNFFIFLHISTQRNYIYKKLDTNN